VSGAAWERVKDLLHAAMQLAPERRSDYLEAVCGADAALRAELDSLLLANAELRAGFLEQTARDAAIADSAGLIYAGRPLLAGEVFAQRFLLVRQLGEGGMGQVWLADQISPVRRQVALKVIKFGMYDESVANRFQSERQSLAMMDHPAIAKVFEAGATPQGQPYFVMEYVAGLPITQYCDRRKLNISKRLELFIQACEGVQHAHQKAIIHRDLKPANILVVEMDGQPTPRIIDFGLAKATTPHLAEQTHFTRFGQFMGTPGYMSPEQADPNAQDIDTRTDVYSMGVMLCVLLTGMEPFETNARRKQPLDELLRRLREEEPPKLTQMISADRDNAASNATARATEPKQLMSQLRGDLEWITMKALERERERRYATPLELAADLRRHLNDEPVVARPTSAAYQVRKFIRRHRIAAVIAGIVSVSAIVASSAGLIAVRKQHEAEYQVSQTLQIQARLLIQAAAQRLKDSDVAGAQGIILEVLADPRFMQGNAPAAINVFQEIRAADAQLAVLAGHGSAVYAAAYSPDGTRIVTASEDRTARVWDAHTGAQIAVLSGHGDTVDSAAYSPDGTRIITASFDKTARIWDARTGAQIAVLSGHGDRVYSATYSPDGMRIVTASWDKTARIWDARTGAQIAVLSAHTDRVISAAYSPDGRHVVTASWDRTARIWDARSGVPLVVLSGEGNRVITAAYSLDGTRIVTGSEDKTARIWDARTGAQLTVLAGHGRAVEAAAYSPDGTRIVTASDDGTARIWDALTGQQLAVLSGHTSRVYYASYSPDGARVVTASFDKTARIWDARGGAHIAVLSGNGDRVYSAAYSPDGKRIVTASWDKTARIWDARTQGQLTVLFGHTDRVISAAYSPDGSRIVTSSYDKTARIWDANTGAQLVVLAGHEDTVCSAAYSPDGARVITASWDKTARIWDAKTGAQLAVLSGHDDAVCSVAYSPDGTRIITASWDRTARIWDARTQAQLAVLSDHADRVVSAAYSPDATRIVTASDDKTAHIWDAHTGAPLAVLSGHGDRVYSAAYSPDGMGIVTASADRTVRIWDARTGLQLTALSGHGDTVESAAYSPDGTRVVSASNDKTARVWDAVPVNVTAQIVWAESAVVDPLPDFDRAQLGLSPDSHAKTASINGSACDKAAAAFYDPDRLAAGVSQANINVNIAISACSLEIANPQHAVRFDYQAGRALLARGDVTGAKRQLELAVSNGYPAARIDLAELLVNISAGMLDPQRAVMLYETAWRDGVRIAAFELGCLYEYGIRGAVDGNPQALASDQTKAWSWYQKGAEAGEPNALARLAERDEKRAIAEDSLVRQNALLLRAFRLYSSAAQSASMANWPDAAWMGWRYRRASLARVLAREGMMQQVADAYSASLHLSSARPTTLWEPSIGEL
jgi:WD40 repeat protein/serine/threonine protein kinase